MQNLNFFILKLTNALNYTMTLTLLKLFPCHKLMRKPDIFTATFNRVPLTNTLLVDTNHKSKNCE